MGEWNKILSKFRDPYKDHLVCLRKSHLQQALALLMTLHHLVQTWVSKKWSQYGVDYLHQFFHDDTLKSFEQIRNEFALPRSEFIRYLQLRHFFTMH